MLRRLIYHAFWNFYDHLGLYVLVGIIHALITLGVIAILSHISLSSLSMACLFAIAIGIPLAAILAALSPYSARVAYGEPVRWPSLGEGLKQYFIKMGIVTTASLGVMLILVLNLRFYLIMQGKSNPYLFTILAALDGWLLVLTCFIFWPFLGALSTSGSAFRLRENVYKTLVWIVMLPKIWVFVGVVGLFILWASFVTRFGLLIYVPAMVVLTQTAAFLSAQYIEFLAKARNEVDTENGIRALKKRAITLTEEWEAQQPRRTIKELIKPWEM